MSEYIKREYALNQTITVRHFDGKLGGVCDHQYVRVEDINAIPAADVEPVVRGEWVTKPPYDDWMICSVCGKDPLCNGIEQEVLSDFCPHCGAALTEAGLKKIAERSGSGE